MTRQNPPESIRKLYAGSAYGDRSVQPGVHTTPTASGVRIAAVTPDEELPGVPSFKDHSFVEMDIAAVPAIEAKDVLFRMQLFGDHPDPYDLFIELEYAHFSGDWHCGAFVASHDGSSLHATYGSESTGAGEAPALAAGDVIRLQVHDDTVQGLLNGVTLLDFAAGTDITSWSIDFGWKVLFLLDIENLTASGTNASPSFDLVSGEVAISAIRAGTLEYDGLPEEVRWEETFDVDGSDPGPDWESPNGEHVQWTGVVPANWAWELDSEIHASGSEAILGYYTVVVEGSPPATSIGPPTTGIGIGTFARTLTEVVTPGL